MVKRDLNVFGNDESDSDEVEEQRETKAKRLKVPGINKGTKISDEVEDNITAKNGQKSIQKDILPSSFEASLDHHDYMNFPIDDEPRPPSAKSNYDDQQHFNRESALKTSLFARPEMSIGLSMMEKMGFKVGDMLGKNKLDVHGSTAPIDIAVKQDRTGIGADISTDLTEFRNRVADSSRESKLVMDLARIQKLCFEMSGEANKFYDGMALESVDPLWRKYVSDNEAKTIRMKNNSKRIRIDDKEDVSTGDGPLNASMDLELDPQENLFLLLQYLRLVHKYCWYCGEVFEDAQDLDSNCPGITEESHNQ